MRSSSNLRYWRALQSSTHQRENFLYLIRCGTMESVPSRRILSCLVVLEVALEPFDMAVAFEREDVGRDAVEEPAIVADDDGAAGEILQRLFERAQRIDVEIVGRLVEQQHVGAGLEHLGEMHAVALAARERADLLLLIGALEIERSSNRRASSSRACRAWMMSLPPEISSHTFLLPSSVSRD